LTVYPLFVISTSVLLLLARISELVIIEVFANHGVFLLLAVISELRQPKSREKSTILVQISTQYSVVQGFSQYCVENPIQIVL
jgi:hypothetical protein